PSSRAARSSVPADLASALFFRRGGLRGGRQRRRMEGTGGRRAQTVTERRRLRDKKGVRAVQGPRTSPPRGWPRPASARTTKDRGSPLQGLYEDDELARV